MTTLVVLRAVQGGVTGATISITQGIVADVFSPEERGKALGLYFVPLLVGPIISPVIGGALANSLSWRGVFVLLGVISLPLLLIVYAIPETQHWAMIRTARLTGKEYSEGTSFQGVLVSAPPSYMPPWVPIKYIGDSLLTPYIVLNGVLFGVLFSSLSSLPLLLVGRWPQFTPAIVGALYLPIGITMLVSSVVGGILSDKAGGRRPDAIKARLVPSLLGACSMPLGSLVFGWGFHYNSLPVALFGHCIIGLGHAVFGPGFFAYLSTVKQNEAAGASAAALALSFVCAGVTISAGVPLIELHLGVGGYRSLLAAVTTLGISWCLWDMAPRRQGVVDGGVGGMKELAPVSGIVNGSL